MLGMEECGPDGKHMAEEEALRALKKILAQDWMKKYGSSPDEAGEEGESESPKIEGLEELGKTAMGEGDEAAPSDSEDKGGLHEELMKYMKPQVKERRPGTALMIAVEKKMSPMKKGSMKKKG